MSDTAAAPGSGTGTGTGPCIGLDWGWSIFATTSDGHMLGHGCCTRLTGYDRAITALQKALSRNGVKFRASQRWRTLTRRIRGWVRSETGRVLNGLVAVDVRSIVNLVGRQVVMTISDSVTY
ncbi:hypothetical protein [Rhodococcus sp. 24CO]|uniref:hypothetical protein n=1 Tax=Rhodococcus sp. 24CO TaxID=3117460 RepID=UPI003D355758